MQFPMVAGVPGFRKMTRMCLASILYHHDWLSSYLPSNHVFLITSHAHRTAEILSHSTDTSITYPWNDDNAFTGIPPTTAILQQISSIKHKQQRLVAEFVEEVPNMDILRLSESNLQNILNNFERRFLESVASWLSGGDYSCYCYWYVSFSGGFIYY
jgi:hypothetical protein